MKLSVLPNLPLALRVDRGDVEAAASIYTIIGPSEVMNTLSHVMDGGAAAQGLLAPLSEITLPEESRSAAGVPLSASHYAFGMCRVPWHGICTRSRHPQSPVGVYVPGVLT